MKKIILILAVIILIIIVAVFAVSLGSDSQVADNSNVANNIESGKVSFKTLTASFGGVDVSIENIIRKDNKTVVELSYNNHQYDLSAMDAKSGSNFAGVKPSIYEVLDSTMGGHHAQATAVFDGDLYGELVIGLNESLIFKFNI